jgi:hypothetical protein
MFKMNQIIFLPFFVLIFCSCNGQLNTSVGCKEKFKEARDLVYGNPNTIRQSALDSALNLANECLRLKCDSIKKAVVDFKITLLISMKKYSEGVSFVDSLRENDFSFNYKKKLMSKNLQALSYASKNDTIQRNLIYAEIANDLERYIKKENIKGKEFEEIYLDLYAIKGNFLDENKINQEIDSLKKEYPNKQDFFDYLKK